MIREKILCIDDNPLIVDMISSVLEKEGFSLICASDGVEAIEKIYHEVPDLILLDVMLPRMGGYEVCRVIKEIEETSGLPVIMVTARDHKIDRLMGKTAGVDEYMTKPFEPPELLNKVKSLLSKCSKQIEESKKLLFQTDIFKKKHALTIEDILAKINKVLDRKLFEAHLINEINRIGHSKYGYEEVMFSVLDVFYKAIDYDIAAAVFPFREENHFVLYSGKILSQDFINVFKNKTYELLSPDLKRCFNAGKAEGSYKYSAASKEDPQKENISSFHISVRKRKGMDVSAFIFSSHIRNAYDEYNRKIMDMLADHAAPVIENAFWLDAQRQMKEDKIKAKEGEMWERTFNSISEMVAIINSDFKIVKVNKAFAETYRMKPEELVGRTCYEVTHGMKEPMPDCPHKKTMETKNPAMIEFMDPGTSKSYEISTSPIFDEKGKTVSPIASVHITKDITERKKMAEELLNKYQELFEAKKEIEKTTGQLIQSEKLAAIGEFAVGVAHEINNPLTAISMNTAFLIEALKDDGKKLKQLRTIEKETERTVKIVRQLLTFSRRKNAHESEIADVNLIVDETLKPVEYQLNLSNIKIIRKFVWDLPKVKINSNQIQQVFLNLVTNARDAMPAGGSLTIATKVQNSKSPAALGHKLKGESKNTFNQKKFIEISFKDTGCGIPADEIKEIFEPFYTTKTAEKGTGLGLSVSHQIIDAHGGMIEVKSKVGSGTAFTVKLPVRQDNR